MIEARTRLRAPATVAVALWLDAWLRGASGADDLIAVLGRAAPDCPLRGADPDRTFDVVLAELRAADLAGAWPVLPRPGRQTGWPRELADDAQPAVLLVGPGPLVRGVLLAGAGGWRRLELADAAHDAGTTLALLADALPARSATRRFGELLTDATAELVRLDLARPAPAVAAAAQRWSAELRRLPPAAPRELVDLVHRVAGVLDALDLALTDQGAAVTAGESAARSTQLQVLHDRLTDLLVSAVVGTAAAP